MLSDENLMNDAEQEAAEPTAQEQSHYQKFAGYQKAVEENQVHIRDFAKEERDNAQMQ